MSNKGYIKLQNDPSSSNHFVQNSFQQQQVFIELIINYYDFYKIFVQIIKILKLLVSFK